MAHGNGWTYLLYAQEMTLVNLVVEEQSPFLILGKSLSPSIPFVDNDNVRAGLMRQEYFIV